MDRITVKSQETGDRHSFDEISKNIFRGPNNSLWIMATEDDSRRLGSRVTLIQIVELLSRTLSEDSSSLRVQYKEDEDKGDRLEIIFHFIPPHLCVKGEIVALSSDR